MNIVITCEHGGNRVPEEYLHLFAGEEELLASHRGYDAGSLEVGRSLAECLEVPFFFSEISRLLVDLNRSPHHRGVFSSITRTLPEKEKERILETWYFPHRNAIERRIGELVKGGKPVHHFAIHSFTPELNGQVRNAELGLLYDPRRKAEKVFCRALGMHLKEAGIGRVRMNYPYLGIADGLTTWLRRQFPEEFYRGVEIEMNSALFADNSQMLREIVRALGKSLFKLAKSKEPSAY